MKILLMTNVFPNPYQPTKGTFNLDMVRSIGADHEVRVVSPVSWIDEVAGWWRSGQLLGAARQAVVAGVEVHYPRYYYSPRILRGLYGLFFRLSVARTVRRLLATFHPDVVLGYWAHPDGEVAVRTARRVGAAAAVLVGGSDVLLLADDHRRRRRIVDVLHSADAVITVGEHLRTRVLQFGLAPAKVHAWNRGIETTAFCPGSRSAARARLGIPSDESMLLWVGRMVPVKGLDVLLEACARLRNARSPFHLHLVGDGPLRGSLEARAAALGLTGVVSFAGPRSHDQLPDWYRAADLTVLPSRSEGVPNVLLESLACGTPFVASRVGGIPEIATEPCLRLVPPEHPAALASAIAAALTELGEADRLPAVSTSRSESACALVRILEPLVTTPWPGGDELRDCSSRPEGLSDRLSPPDPALQTSR